MNANAISLVNIINILSPRHFVAATCHTKFNWFGLVPHATATNFGTKNSPVHTMKFVAAIRRLPGVFRPLKLAKLHLLKRRTPHVSLELENNRYCVLFLKMRLGQA